MYDVAVGDVQAPNDAAGVDNRRACPAAPESTSMSPRYFWSLIAIAMVAAFIARFPFLGKPGFPLGEGGLFVLFSQAVLDHGFAFPTDVIYGGQKLPFAYPPLGFYLAAAAARLTGASLFSIFYWMPLLLNFAAIPAFAFLSRETLRHRCAVAAATILYAVVLQSFQWQITGGGLTRSLGTLLGIVAVTFALKAGSGHSRRLAVFAGAFTGLAILSHMEWGLFAAGGVTLAYITSCRIARASLLAILSGIVAAVVIAPWVLMVVQGHGLEPFLSSSATSEWDITGFVISFFTAGSLGLLAWPTALGTFVAISRKEYFLPIWAPLVMLLTPRMGGTQGLAIPGTLLAGIGVAAAISFVTRRIQADPDLSARDRALFDEKRLGGLGIVGLVAIPALAIMLISLPQKDSAALTTLDQLTSDERSAMQWIARNTPTDSRFVIIDKAKEWYSDRLAEWFPFLTSRTSLTTAQGLEWAGRGVFSRKRRQILLLKRVQSDVLPQAILHRFCDANFVVAFLKPSNEARGFLSQAAEFRIVYQNAGAAVLEISPRHRCVR